MRVTRDDMRYEFKIQTNVKKTVSTYHNSCVRIKLCNWFAFVCTIFMSSSRHSNTTVATSFHPRLWRFYHCIRNFQFRYGCIKQASMHVGRKHGRYKLCRLGGVALNQCMCSLHGSIIDNQRQSYKGN